MSGNEARPAELPQQLGELLDAYPDIEIFEAILPDLNGRLRGKWIARSKIDKAFNGGLKLPLSTLAFDIWGRDPEAWVYEAGDADGICDPDPRSLAPVPWLERSTAQVLVSLNEVSGQPCAYDPRAVLRRLQVQFEQRGMTPVIATEMEFYLFKNECDDNGRPRHTQTEIGGAAAIGGQTYGIDAMQDVAAVMHGIRDACEAQNLPVDTLITEAAPSQYEINLYHQADPLLAADQGLMLQRAIKGIAQQHAMRASFMAKPFIELAGNGMHVHCSLVDKKGNNVFNNDTDEGSTLLRHAIAGCLAAMGDCMLLFAPHLNSYRRFQPDNHAPTAPTWGYENRTVAVRVPADRHEATRIEHRVAGADASPHLVIAAIIAGMLHGIENEMEAPPPLAGDAYKQCDPVLPDNWPEALRRFSQSEFVLHYFGEEFRRVYAATKQQEIAEFQKHVTPLEYQSYL
ncbi:MAG: glutamine synthetase family protein [Gammaproteobacteria bacterium]|nr:glutamine synthetase family protein [Gammaproteobacteria bacterium]